jgi:hypothetical protein
LQWPDDDIETARIISEDLDTRRNAAFPAADPIRGA